MSLGGASSNFPLRGGKFGLYDGGVRVRGLVHSPILHKKRHNKTWDGLMYISDIPKTIVGMAAGVKKEVAGNIGDSGAPLDALDSHSPRSYNLWPSIMAGSFSPRKEIILQPLNKYWHGGHCTEAWIQNPYHPHCGAAFLLWPYKLIIGNPGDRRIVPGNFSKRFTWSPIPEEEIKEVNISSFGTHQVRLFNVQNDPGERHNLALEPRNDGVLQVMLRMLLFASQQFRKPTLGSDLSPPPKMACMQVRNTGSWRPWEPSRCGDVIRLP